MARAIKLLRYQMNDYWRRAFSVRGRYDRLSGILLLIAAAFAYKYISILNSSAQSIADGKTENLDLILIIVSLVWFLPALENQQVSSQHSKFLFLPLTKNQFALIDLAAFFLLPTALIAAVVSLAAIYPLLFAEKIFGGVAGILIFAFSAALLISAFFNLLRMKIFRIAVFLLAFGSSLFLLAGKIDLATPSDFFPARGFSEMLSRENAALNFLDLIALLAAAFFLNFLSVRLTLFSADQTDGRLRLRFPPQLRLPFRFGELIKKDFIYSWKMLDSYISLLVVIFYAILLWFGNFSFESFSVAVSVAVMMSASLAFNNFGMEKASGIERLSLLPIKARDLIAAKNKAFALTVFSQVFLLFPLVFYKFGAVFFIASILKTISIILLYAAWGNNLSIRHPFRMDFYQVSFGGSLPAIIYGVLLISILTIAPEFLTARNLAAKLVFNIISVAASFWIYRLALQKVSLELPAKWEEIALKLS